MTFVPHLREFAQKRSEFQCEQFVGIFAMEELCVDGLSHMQPSDTKSDTKSGTFQ